MNSSRLLGLGVALLVVAALNFIPTLIAFARRHPDRVLLAKLNVLSLLSFLRWFALLVWAVGGARNDSVIGRFVGDTGNRGKLAAIVGVPVLIGGGITAYAVTR